MSKELLTLLTELSRYKGATPVSFSRANSMMSCPLKWKLQYVDKEKAAPYADQEATDVGKFLHQVSEYHMLQARARNFYTFSEQRFADAWDHVAPHYTTSVVTRAQENMRVGAEKVAEGLFKVINHYSFKPSTEIRLGMNRSGRIVQGIPWREALWVGIMDLHMLSPKYRGTLITDYKSHAKQAAFTDKEKLQIDSYALLEYLREPSLTLVQTNIAYFSTGTTDTVGNYKPGDVEDITNRFIIFLQQYFDLVRRAIYDPVAGDHCIWCGYTSKCPLK